MIVSPSEEVCADSFVLTGITSEGMLQALRTIPVELYPRFAFGTTGSKTKLHFKAFGIPSPNSGVAGGDSNPSVEKYIQECREKGVIPLSVAEIKWGYFRSGWERQQTNYSNKDAGFSFGNIGFASEFGMSKRQYDEACRLAVIGGKTHSLSLIIGDLTGLAELKEGRFLDSLVGEGYDLSEAEILFHSKVISMSYRKNSGQIGLGNQGAYKISSEDNVIKWLRPFCSELRSAD